MPITSNDVTNIIAGQQGMFSAAAGYAQAVSAMYGFQPSGAPFGQDPRAQGEQAIQAGNLGGMAARMPGIGMGMLSGAAMFGFGPRMLDPFSGTAMNAMRGFSAGGMGGAIGMGGLTAAGYAGLGAVGGFATQNMVAGAQTRGLLNNQFSQMMPNAGARQLGGMSSIVESASQQGLGQLRDLMGVVQGGLGSGAIQGNTVSEFRASFSKLLQNVREVATVMNSSLTEATGTMQQLKGMGIASDQAARFAGVAKGIGKTIGAGPDTMMNVARAGSMMARTAGTDLTQGAYGAMVTSGVFGMVGKQGLVEGVRGQDAGRYTQGALRFLGSRRGRTVLGAMMTPEGEFSAENAMEIAQGATRSDIQRMYRQGGGKAGRDLMGSRGNEIAMQFISQYGPSGVANPLHAMTAGRANPETMQQALTGLNRKELGALDQLAASGPQFRQKLADAARRGIQQGQASVGLGDAVGAAINAITKPLQDKFRAFGASMTQAIQETLQDITREFVSSPPPAADPNAYMQEFRASITGNKAYQGFASTARREGNQALGGFKNDYGMMRPPGMQGFMGDLIRGLPMGLRLGAMPPGTGLGDLPGYGMLAESYNPRGTAFSVASAASVFPGGRNVFGATGAGLMRGGSAVMNMFNAKQAGPMGIGGLGPVSGTGRLAGATAWAGGGALRGFGAATRALGPAMLAADLAFNVYPEMQRRTGQRGITEGAVLGRSARMLNFLGGMGQLGDASLMQLQMGEDGVSQAEVKRRGLIPVGGLIPGQDFGMGVAGAGSQMFGTRETVEEAQKLFDDSMDISDIVASAGGQKRVEKVIQDLSTKADLTDSEKVHAIMRDLGVSQRDAVRIALNPSVNKGKAILTVGHAGGAVIRSKHDVEKVRKGVREDIKKASVEAAQKSINLPVGSVPGFGGATAELFDDPSSGGAPLGTAGTSPAADATAATSIAATNRGTPWGKAMRTFGKRFLRNTTGSRALSSITGDEAQGLGDRMAAATTMASDLMSIGGEASIAEEYGRLVARYADNKEKIKEKLEDYIREQKSELKSKSDLPADQFDQFFDRTASDLAGQMVDTGGNVGGTSLMTGVYAELTRNQEVYREAVISGHIETDKSDEGRWKILQGRSGIDDTLFDKLKKARDSYEKAFDDEGADLRPKARKDFAEALAGAKLDKKTTTALIQQLGKGGVVSKDLMNAAINTRYYTQAWERSGRSPARFLEKVTGESFKGLGKSLKKFRETGELDIRLEEALVGGAQTVLRAASPGRDVSAEEAAPLAGQLGLGVTAKGVTPELTGALSTVHAPVSPTGGGRKGAADSAKGFVAAMSSATTAINQFLRNSGLIVFIFILGPAMAQALNNSGF
jgi:hypothetical protein